MASMEVAYYTFQGNCPPTLPLSQNFTLSLTRVNVGLGEG